MAPMVGSDRSTCIEGAGHFDGRPKCPPDFPTRSTQCQHFRSGRVAVQRSFPQMVIVTQILKPHPCSACENLLPEPSPRVEVEGPCVSVSAGSSTHRPRRQLLKGEYCQKKQTDASRRCSVLIIGPKAFACSVGGCA